MLCEKCQKETASVHVTKIINGQKIETHLCSECAGDLGEFGWNIDIPNLFASIFEQSHPWTQTAAPQQRCSTCSSTLNDFRRLNQFGCGDCYMTFRSEVEPLLRRLHGTIRHEGKIPAKSYAKLSINQKVKLLRDKLQQEILVENYEEAARLRDEIRELEKQLNSKGEE